MLNNWQAHLVREDNGRGPAMHYEISAGEIGNRQCIVQCIYSERYARAIVAAMNSALEGEEENVKVVCPVR